MTPPIRMIFFIAAFSLLCAIIIGCKTTKDVQKSSGSYDSTRVTELVSTIKAHESTIAVLQQQIRELQYSSVQFDKACDTIIQYMERNGCDTSVIAYMREKLSKAQNEIEILADGTIKAKGQIVSANVTKEKLTTTVTMLQHEINVLRMDLVREQSNVKIQWKEKTVHKVTKVLTQWWVLLIVFVGGFIAGKRFGGPVTSKIQSIFNSIKQRV